MKLKNVFCSTSSLLKATLLIPPQEIIIDVPILYEEKTIELNFLTRCNILLTYVFSLVVESGDVTFLIKHPTETGSFSSIAKLTVKSL